MNPYYELHVTLLPEYKAEIEPVAKRHKFKVSALVGDEIMGDDKLIYCTCHDKTYAAIEKRMNDLIRDLGAPILRKKIECILLDERFSNESPRTSNRTITETRSYVNPK